MLKNDNTILEIGDLDEMTVQEVIGYLMLNYKMDDKFKYVDDDLWSATPYLKIGKNI